MKLAIVIPTYRKIDGSTPKLLTRAIESILNQTHKDFKLIIIGDRYDIPEEFESLRFKYESDKIYFENLPVAAERDIYTDKTIIWNCAGANANNHGIDVAIKMGYEYVCHLDHDDWWYPNHLQEINDAIENLGADFIFTKAVYEKRFLPAINTNKKYLLHLPIPSGMVHSSMCMNFKTIPLKHRNVYLETGRIYPGDADMWDRVGDYIKKHGLKSYYINVLTCNHEEEGFEKLN